MSNDIVPVHLVQYPDDADLDIKETADGPVVKNHDEVEKIDVVRGLRRDSVEEVNLESQILEPGDGLWREEFADIEAGDEVRLFGDPICDYCGGYITENGQDCPALDDGVCAP